MLHGNQPQDWPGAHTHTILNHNSTGKQKQFLPFLWYIEASECLLLNRRMMDKQKANTSDREHPPMLLTECNMFKNSTSLNLMRAPSIIQ